MQLFSNNGRSALALALKLVALSSLACAQNGEGRANTPPSQPGEGSQPSQNGQCSLPSQNSQNSQGPISYLSASPSLNIRYSWAYKCDLSNSCLSATLVPGACCMLNFQSQYAMLVIAKSLSYR